MLGLNQRYHHELKFHEEGVEFGWSDHATGIFLDRHVYRVEPLLHGRTRFVQTDEPQGAIVRVLGGSVAHQTMTAYKLFNRDLKARVEKLHQRGRPAG